MARSRPPVTGTTHALPFSTLGDEDFERLCYALVLREDYERPEHVGAGGGDGGCDIVGFRGGQRVCFQCKRKKKLGPTEAKAVVQKILLLPPGERPHELILMASCSVSKKARDEARTLAGEIRFEVWASTELDARISRYPDLIDQFFHLPPSSTGGVGAIPNRPTCYLDRIVDVAELERQLLVERVRCIGLTGMPGIGKTVLAASLARSAKVEAFYCDKILWVAVGQKPDLSRLLSELVQAWGEIPSVGSQQMRHRQLRKLLEDKRVLLILDDVWKVDHLDALDIVGKEGSLLFTTQNAEIVRGSGATPHAVSELSRDQALQLLADWSQMKVANLPGIAPDLARECGYLPLALAMIGGMVDQDKSTWADALERLARSDLDWFPRTFRGYPHGNLLRALAVSVEALDPADQARYLELSVFPKSKSVPRQLIERLWAFGGLSELDARALLRRLERRSLLQPAENRTVRLHNLQADYVRHETGDLRPLHKRLVDTYTAQCPRGFAQGPNDGYFFQQLPYHLLEAGQRAELRHLLFDFEWLQAKLVATGVNELLRDYDLLADELGARQLQGGLRLAAHVLARDSTQLAGQLLGRLAPNISPDLTRLLHGAQSGPGAPWLRPLICTLTPPETGLLRTLEGHTSGVGAIAVLSDQPESRIPQERLLVSASDDGTLRVWNVDTGQTLHSLPGHQGRIVGVACLDERQVVSAGADITLRLWDVKKGECRQILDGRNLSFLALEVPGDRRVDVSEEGSVSVQDPVTRETLLVAEPVWVQAVARPHHGDATNSLDGPRQVWNVQTGTNLVQDGATALVGDVARLSDTLLVFAAADGSRYLWNLEPRHRFRTLEGHRGPFLVLTRLDGDRVLSSSEDGLVGIWNLETGLTEQTLERPDIITAAALLSDRRICLASSEGTISVLDEQTGLSLHERPEPAGAVRAILPIPPHLIASASEETVLLWDMRSLRVLRRLEGHTDEVLALARLDDQRIVSGSHDETLRTWNVNHERSLRTLARHTSAVRAVARLDSSHVISASDDGALRLWDVDARQALRVPDGHTGSILALEVIDDHRVISASADGTLRVWDVRTGKSLRILNGHEGRVVAVARLDSHRAVSASDDRTLLIWDVDTEIEPQFLDADAEPAYAMTRLDDERIVVAYEDGNLRVWDVDARKILSTLQHPDLQILTLALLDHDHVLFSSDSALYLWDVKTHAPRRVEGSHQQRIHALARLDTDRFVSTYSDSGLRVWDMKTLESPRTIGAYCNAVPSLASIDGRHIVIPSRKTICIWDLEAGSRVDTFTLEDEVSAVLAIPATGAIVVGDQSGRVHFFAFERN